ncbi:Adenine phosphoribosyltransferase [Elusimicrobium minutum Pei191]|uniref:Adenine phosphoribosyltransferase n=1 Tax=Elusimicrobium minutum (strain Pei191) TaxID=445932 RepID=B2KCU0_ELUMP|nr:adenine phosphoribosyltransferase [Elusimicrobium minutum]ACC98336.1 Adenine phosphoribosyltransferase [Elusimicrobium minutum Pei191]
MNIDLKKYILDVPNFPIHGIGFKDITPLLNNKDAFKTAINLMIKDFKDKGVTKVAGIDSRGFILSAPAAYALNAGFVPVRKKGKLPRSTYCEKFAYEYDEAHLEIHTDAFSPADKILLIDDVLATGGTAEAAVKLIKKSGAELIGISFLLEISFLKGIDKLDKNLIKTIIRY